MQATFVVVSVCDGLEQSTNPYSKTAICLCEGCTQQYKPFIRNWYQVLIRPLVLSVWEHAFPQASQPRCVYTRLGNMWKEESERNHIAFQQAMGRWIENTSHTARAAGTDLGQRNAFTWAQNRWDSPRLSFLIPLFHSVPIPYWTTEIARERKNALNLFFFCLIPSISYCQQAHHVAFTHQLIPIIQSIKRLFFSCFLFPLYLMQSRVIY